MLQLILGLALIAVAGVLLFYGQQHAREGWANVYHPAPIPTPLPAPVSVTPEEFSLGDKNWAPRTTLFVTNNTAKPLYNVQIRVLATNTELTFNDLHLDVDARDFAPKLELKDPSGSGSYIWDTDHLVVYGFENSNHAPFAEIEFGVIPPGDRRRMTVWSEGRKGSGARASVTNFSEVQRPPGAFVPQDRQSSKEDRTPAPSVPSSTPGASSAP